MAKKSIDKGGSKKENKNVKKKKIRKQGERKLKSFCCTGDVIYPREDGEEVHVVAGETVCLHEDAREVDAALLEVPQLLLV